MARSHHRHKKHHPQQQHAASSKMQRRAAPVLAILVGIFGLCIGYFGSGNNFVALALGTVIWAVVGFFIGNSLDKIARQK
jgi:uncharacterized membrane protein